MISKRAERWADAVDTGSERAVDDDVPLRDYALIGDCHGARAGGLGSERSGAPRAHGWGLTSFHPSHPAVPSWLPKLIVLALLGVVLAVAYTQFGEYLSLEEVARQEAAFREFQRSHPILVYGAAFGAYVAVTALSLPGAAAMTPLMGWLFGFWQAVLLVSFASTTGATLAFLLSRYLFRESIQQKFGDRLERFNEALKREEAFYLLTLRLIPAVPFFVINVVMGLTLMRPWTFWWVSQVGMLPGTTVYVYAGANVPTLQELARQGAGSILSTELMIAFALLGLFPLVTKKLLGLWRRSSGTSDFVDSDEEDAPEPRNDRPRHRSGYLSAHLPRDGSV